MITHALDRIFQGKNESTNKVWQYPCGLLQTYVMFFFCFESNLRANRFDPSFTFLPKSCEDSLEFDLSVVYAEKSKLKEGDKDIKEKNKK